MYVVRKVRYLNLEIQYSASEIHVLGNPVLFHLVSCRLFEEFFYEFPPGHWVELW